MKKEPNNEVLELAIQEWFELVLAIIQQKKETEAKTKEKNENGKKIHN